MFPALLRAPPVDQHPPHPAAIAGSGVLLPACCPRCSDGPPSCSELATEPRLRIRLGAQPRRHLALLPIQALASCRAAGCNSWTAHTHAGGPAPSRHPGDHLAGFRLRRLAAPRPGRAACSLGPGGGPAGDAGAAILFFLFPLPLVWLNATALWMQDLISQVASGVLACSGSATARGT